MNTIARLVDLRRREHEATIELVIALCECVRRREHVAAGHASLWSLLVERLHYSPAAASRRNAAVKIALRFPVVLEMLRAHRVSLTTLARVAFLLDQPGFEDVLAAIDGESADEVDRIVARFRPRARPVERVKRTAVKAAGMFDRKPKPARAVAPKPTSTAEPVEDRVQITFSLSAADYAAFQRARAIASRKHGPGVTVEQTVVEMVTYFVDRAPKRKREPKPSARRTRHLPAATRRAVETRDGRRCTWLGPDGTRCSATHDLQVDHVRPFSQGGSHALENLRLLCGTHNWFRVQGGVPPRNQAP